MFGILMRYHVTHWTGEMESDFPASRFGELLDELAIADTEHPDVSLTHESEWCVTISKSGHAILENLESGEPVHMGPLTREEQLLLLHQVSKGRIMTLRAHPWRPGYPGASRG